MRRRRSKSALSAILRTSFVLIAAALPLEARAPLFPQALHLTRELVDAITGETLVLDEYYEGDRVIAVRGDVVAAADYASGELLRIDRAAGTWSVVPFEGLARASESLARRGANRVDASPPALIRAADASILGRRVEVFRTPDGAEPRIEVSIDRAVSLTREAAEVLLGAAYPNRVQGETRAVLAAAAGPAAPRGVAAMAAPSYGLPVETIVTFRVGEERVVHTDRVIRIAFEAPPSAILEIPPGATRVEDARLEAVRRLDSLDRVPSDAAPQR